MLAIYPHSRGDLPDYKSQFHDLPLKKNVGSFLFFFAHKCLELGVLSFQAAMKIFHFFAHLFDECIHLGVKMVIIAPSHPEKRSNRQNNDQKLYPFSHKFPANIDLLTLSGCHSLSELEPESLLVLTFHPAQTSVLQSKVNSNGVKIFIYFVESDIYPVEPFINLFKSFINLFKSFIKSCIKPFKHRPHHSDDGNRTSNSRPVHNFSPFEAKILAYQINELQEAAS